MSCMDWEYGTITLPSAEVAPLKRVLREHINALHEAARTEAIRRHKRLGTRSKKRYIEAFYQGGFCQRTGTVDAVATLVLSDLAGAVRSGESTIHVPTVADVAAVVPRLTNRDTVFPVISSDGQFCATVVIEGRALTWDVPENNHATDFAHDSDLAQVLFSRLDRIKFTRGSGGVIVGNNEYHRDDTYPGGGGNYVVVQFGPDH